MTEPSFTELTADMIKPLTEDSFKPFPPTDTLEYRDLGVAEATTARWRSACPAPSAAPGQLPAGIRTT